VEYPPSRGKSTYPRINITMWSIRLVGEEHLSQNSDYDVEYPPSRGKVLIPELRVRWGVSP